MKSRESLEFLSELHQRSIFQTLVWKMNNVLRRPCLTHQYFVKIFKVLEHCAVKRRNLKHTTYKWIRLVWDTVIGACLNWIFLGANNHVSKHGFKCFSVSLIVTVFLWSQLTSHNVLWSFDSTLCVKNGAHQKEVKLAAFFVLIVSFLELFARYLSCQSF